MKGKLQMFKGHLLIKVTLNLISNSFHLIQLQVCKQLT